LEVYGVALVDFGTRALRFKFHSQTQIGFKYISTAVPSVANSDKQVWERRFSLKTIVIPNMGSKIRLHSLLSNFASLPARPALGDASVVNQEYDIPTDEGKLTS
jgi:hypothetical protein